jgi:hypothetical protein
MLECLDTEEGKNHFNASNFFVHVNPCYCHVLCDNNKTIVGGYDDKAKKDETGAPITYPWRCYVFSHDTPVETRDARMLNLYGLVQDFLKKDDKKPNEKWSKYVANKAKGGTKRNNVYPTRLEAASQPTSKKKIHFEQQGS